MLSRIRVTTASKAAAAVALLLVSLTACQHPQPQPSPPPPKVVFNETYDREIKEILELARQNRWEDAQTKVAALYRQDPRTRL